MKAKHLEEEEPPITVVGYTRVSTDKQSRHGRSLDAQKKMIAQYCSYSNLNLLGVVEEPGVSAGKRINQRPGLVTVLGMIEDGEADGVVVLKLDRIFRSVVDAAEVLELLRSHGAAFHSVVERFDTSTPWGEASMQIVTVFAQMERKMAGERTKSVLHATKRVMIADLPPEASAAMVNRAQKNKLLLGNTSYGYEFASPRIRKAREVGDMDLVAELEELKARHGEMIPHPGELEIVQFIKNRRKYKNSRQIADQLNAKGYRTRKGTPWLKNQVWRILNRHF